MVEKCQYCDQLQPKQWDRGGCFYCGAPIDEPYYAIKLMVNTNDCVFPSTDCLTEFGYDSYIKKYGYFSTTG